MDPKSRFVAAALLIATAFGMVSCGSSVDPNIGRVLTGITVTPQTADAQTSSNRQVVFSATGTFSLPPTPAPVTFVGPYAGQFFVDNPAGSTIATVIATGNNGTITVQCAAGATGTVPIVASALANNGSTTVVSGSSQLTCP